MSTILGNTRNGTTADAAFSTKCDLDNTPPEGFSLTCAGLSTKGNNPGTVGVIFQLTVPKGYSVHFGDNETGSWIDQKISPHYNMMKLGIDQDGGDGGMYQWELWFAQDDTDGQYWSLPWVMTLNAAAGKTGSTYTYRFTKGGSGGGRRH